MIRIVIDTNVYISALVFDGKPAIVLQLAEALGIELVTSLELESELVGTLTSKFGWSAQRVREATERLWERAHWGVTGAAFRDCPRSQRQPRARGSCGGRLSIYSHRRS